MRIFYFIFVLSFLSLKVSATHNRAGEITYKCLGGTTYEITITTYTKLSGESINADRNELYLYYDYFTPGAGDTISRNGNFVDDIPNDVRTNYYKSVYTYPGPGIYTLAMSDLNRNADVVNIPNAINVPFFIMSKLYIAPFVANNCNNSPILTYRPVDQACIGKLFMHNPGAVDIDGDSLSYSLDSCRLDPSTVTFGYSIPDSVRVDKFGTFIWNFPVQLGEFNFVIIISEWRKNASNRYVKIGEVRRDMQILVRNCTNNPPVVTATNPCIEAGTLGQVDVQANDADGNFVRLFAEGLPLQVNSNPVPFTQGIGGIGQIQTSLFWNTNCSHVLNIPYNIVFKATDNGNPSLVGIVNSAIRVIAPKPINLQATPSTNTIILSWQASICNDVESYKIYRRKGSINVPFDPCFQGLPNGYGYNLIATVNGTISSIIDNQNGVGLIIGESYCYRVVAVYENGAESYYSDEICAELKKDAPVLTHVSIENTAENGQIYLAWSFPSDLDTNIHEGPYKYKIARRQAQNNYEIIDSTAISNNLFDTIYFNNNINTIANQYEYKIELYNEGSLRYKIAESTPSQSILLRSNSFDNRIELKWAAVTPWENQHYTIYRQLPGASNFDSLTTVSTLSYNDTGLVNGASYCYYILSKGEYSRNDITKPLLNKSNIHCAEPIDLEAPCPPNVSIIYDCNNDKNELNWNNPNLSCADDVVKYHIYYKPTSDASFSKIATINDANTTFFLHNNEGSLAGCYYVTALDSFENESIQITPVCVDNCPLYQLPNVFTPDGDGINDYFTPFPYKFVESIDLKIYNRWGALVFETKNPDINWNGIGVFDNPVSQGVYFYHCVVNEIRLSGIEPRELKGNVQIFKNGNEIPQKK